MRMPIQMIGSPMASIPSAHCIVKQDNHLFTTWHIRVFNDQFMIIFYPFKPTMAGLCRCFVVAFDLYFGNFLKMTDSYQESKKLVLIFSSKNQNLPKYTMIWYIFPFSRSNMFRNFPDEERPTSPK